MNYSIKNSTYAEYIHTSAELAKPQILANPYTFTSFTAALHPWFITAFVDGEGCFTVSILRVKDSKLGWRVKAIFQIGLLRKLQKDKALLEEIKSYFCVGSIIKHGPQSI